MVINHTHNRAMDTDMAPVAEAKAEAEASVCGKRKHEQLVPATTTAVAKPKSSPRQRKRSAGSQCRSVALLQSAKPNPRKGGFADYVGLVLDQSRGEDPLWFRSILCRRGWLVWVVGLAEAGIDIARKFLNDPSALALRNTRACRGVDAWAWPAGYAGIPTTRHSHDCPRSPWEWGPRGKILRAIERRYPVLYDFLIMREALWRYTKAENERRLLNSLRLPFSFALLVESKVDWSWRVGYGAILRVRRQCRVKAFVSKRRKAVVIQTTAGELHGNICFRERSHETADISIRIPADQARLLCHSDPRAIAEAPPNGLLVSLGPFTGRDLSTAVPFAETFVGTMCLVKALRRRYGGELVDKQLFLEEVLPLLSII